MTEQATADAILRNALELQRLSANDEAEALRIMRRLERELRSLLSADELSTAQRRVIRQIIADADAAITGHYRDMAKVVDVEELMVMVADKTATAMRELNSSAGIPTAARMRSLRSEVLIEGSPLAAWWNKQAEDLSFRFAAEVRQGVTLELTNEQIVSRIVGRGDEPGILPIARRHVRTLVHSSIMASANTARLETYRKNAKYASGVRWLSTLDSNTCVTCMALDGSRWDFEGKKLGDTTLDFNFPPAHPNCRCVLTPIARSLDGIFPGIDDAIRRQSRRASSEGLVADMSFEAFLRRQDRAFVEDVLGPGRADLWLSGRITLTDLVSGSGRPLTLSQIAGR